MKAKAALLSLLLASPAWANPISLGDLSLPITGVFAEYGVHGGFYLPPNAPPALTQCSNGVMYISLETPAGRATYAGLLAAKTAGWHVVRITFTRNQAGGCMVDSLHFN
jgi:hypothetical protein